MSSLCRLAFVLFLCAVFHGEAILLKLSRSCVPLVSSRVSLSGSCLSSFQRWPSAQAATAHFSIGNTATTNRWGPTYEEMEECWTADSWSVNPLNVSKIDDILRCLNSPAPQSFFVIDRAIRMARSSNTPLVDALQGFGYLLKPGFQLLVVRGKDQNIPEKVSWEVSPCNEAPRERWQAVTKNDNIKEPTVLDMANELLSTVIEASENQQYVEEFLLDAHSMEAVVSRHFLRCFQEESYFSLDLHVESAKMDSGNRYPWQVSS